MFLGDGNFLDAQLAFFHKNAASHRLQG